MSDIPKKSAHPVLRGICIFLLVILLIIGGSLGFLYYSLATDTVTMDDPAALAAQVPMPAARRFVFDAAGETAQIRLDKSDLWWLLLPEMDENLLENVNRELESYRLSITGYGFNITEEGICIDVEAMYQSLRLPVHIQTSLDFDASGFSLTLSNAKLGPVPLPVADLLRTVDVRLDVDWPVITDITGVSCLQDTVVLTGTLTQDMLSCARDAGKNDTIGWFSASHQTFFRAAHAKDGFRELLPGLEKDPGSVETLYHDLFTMAEEYEYENFMEASRDLSHRFFPGIDYTAWKAENDSVRAEWTFYNEAADKLVTQISADFNSRRFKLKNGKFYLKNAEFDVLSYTTGDTAQEIRQLFDVIDREQVRLILVGSINGYNADSPALNKICDRNQQLTQELDRKEAYCVGCVFRGINGEYFLRYESMKLTGRENKMSKWLKTIPLSEADYASLFQEGLIGVWIS